MHDDLPGGCVWAMIVLIICVLGFSIVSGIAKGLVWIRWAFG